MNKFNLEKLRNQVNQELLSIYQSGPVSLVNPINYGLEDDLDASFEYNLSDEYNV